MKIFSGWEWGAELYAIAIKYHLLSCAHNEPNTVSVASETFPPPTVKQGNILLHFNQWRDDGSENIHNFPDHGMQLDMFDSRRCDFSNFSLILELRGLIPCSISPWIPFP